MCRTQSALSTTIRRVSVQPATPNDSLCRVPVSISIYLSIILWGGLIQPIHCLARVLRTFYQVYQLWCSDVRGGSCLDLPLCLSLLLFHPYFFSVSLAKAAVLSGFGIGRDLKDSTKLTLTWDSSQDTNCLYSNPFFSVKVYLSWVATNHSNCTAAYFNGSTDVTEYQNHSLVLHSKEYYVTYCILTEYQLALKYGDTNINSYKLKESVDVTAPSSTPPTSSSHGGMCEHVCVVVVVVMVEGYKWCWFARGSEHEEK